MSKTDDEQLARLKRLAAMPEAAIDTTDSPEAPEWAWANAERGRFYRPRKEAITIRVDADVLDWFRTNADGRGYQTAINAALRRHVEERG